MKCGQPNKTRPWPCERPLRVPGTCPRHGTGAHRPSPRSPQGGGRARSGGRPVAGSASTPPAPPAAPAVPRGADRLPGRALGAAAAASLILWLIVLIAAGARAKVFAGALLVAVPAALGALLTRRCTAVRVDGQQRCRQPRRGLFHRCENHRVSWATAYDMAGAAAYILALINLIELSARFLA
jgi:hypothetical protein